MKVNGILYRVYKSFSDDSCYDKTFITGYVHPVVFISSIAFAVLYSITGLLDQLTRHGAIDSSWVVFGILKDIEILFIAFELVMFLLFVIADYEFKKVNSNELRVTSGLVKLGVIAYAFFGLVYINTYLIQEKLISNYHLESIVDMGKTNTTRDQAIGYFVDRYAKLNNINDVVVRRDGIIVNRKTDNDGFPDSHKDIDRILKERYTPEPRAQITIPSTARNTALYGGVVRGLQQIADRDQNQ